MPNPSTQGSSLKQVVIAAVSSMVVGVMLGIGGMAFHFSGEVVALKTNLTNLHDQLENTNGKLDDLEAKLDQAQQSLAKTTNDLVRVVATLEARESRR